MAESKRPRGHRLPCLLFVSALFANLTSWGQGDSTGIDGSKLRRFTITTGALYVAGVAGLNYVWYKDTERQSFRFFNDNAEWKQMDKAGHFFSSFYLSALPSSTLKRCGVPSRKADLYGAIAGFMLTIPIEVMDGFSDGYGASPGDAVADAAGPLFFLGQQLGWNEVRIFPKLSFHRTDFPQRNPQLLGDNLLSEIVKDYNGQTFWLSLDMDRFAAVPAWLNLAVGYGAEGMINARDKQNLARGYDPYRQYFIGLDFDLTAIKTRSKLLRSVLSVVNTVRLPAPAFELSRKGSKFHLFYF